jgi:hypothetical protein
MDKATFLEIMDKYIDGTLSGTEKYDFEQMLKSDPRLQKEFDIHRSIRNGIKRQARKELVMELHAIKKEVNASNDKVKPLFPRWILFGLVGAFISLLVFLYFLRNDNDIEPQTAYAGYLKMKILPKEGNLGLPTAEKIHVVLISNKKNEYEVSGDTLILYTIPENFNTFIAMDPVITLDQNRNIKVEIKDIKYLFTTIKDNK